MSKTNPTDTIIRLEGVPIDMPITAESLRTPPKTVKTQVEVLAVPFIWAALAMLIAKAIVEKLVDKLIDQLFEDPKTQINLQDLIEQFANLVGIIVQQKLDERDLRIMGQKAKSVQDLFPVYKTIHNVTEKAHILSKIIDDAYDLTYQAQPFSYRGVSTYSIAGGLELVGWSEMKEKTHSRFALIS